ncbi:MAG: hypothetical protein Q9163_004606 [Psora crenata]
MSTWLFRTAITSPNSTGLLRASFHTRTAALRSPYSCSQPPQPYAQRQFSQSTWLSYARKSSQDKDSINREPMEYSNSGTDQQEAEQDDPAFNPDITDPQRQKAAAGKTSGDNSNPLDVSPANTEVSKPKAETEGGPQSSKQSAGADSGREAVSGRGSPAKGSKHKAQNVH